MMNISEQGIAVCYWYQQEKTEFMIKKTINLKQLNCKKNSLARPCHLSTPAKFTSPERIKLTLQQGCNVYGRTSGKTNFSYGKGFGY